MSWTKNRREIYDILPMTRIRSARLGNKVRHVVGDSKIKVTTHLFEIHFDSGFAVVIVPLLVDLALAEFSQLRFCVP